MAEDTASAISGISRLETFFPASGWKSKPSNLDSEKLIFTISLLLVSVLISRTSHVRITTCLYPVFRLMPFQCYYTYTNLLRKTYALKNNAAVVAHLRYAANACEVVCRQPCLATTTQFPRPSSYLTVLKRCTTA